jgi:two-component system, NtrC family, sensor kinase
MNFDLILLIIIFIYFRKVLKSKILLPKIDKFLLIGLWLSIVLLIISTSSFYSNYVIRWIAHAMLGGIIYLSFTKIEFKPVKPFIYSIIPLVIVNFLEDVTKIINYNFHSEWENYFRIAALFSFIWFIAMLLIYRKQRKAIEREQLKAIEREKEFQQSELLKAKLEIQVAERTAELRRQKEELQNALNELKSTQSQLIQSEKMASLGELTAGIAHEIQNPLNFVNNFSEVNTELSDEIVEEAEKGNLDEIKIIAKDIKANSEKINHHGKRAESIVKGMLLHSRGSSGHKEPVDVNALCDEYLSLSYHGFRAKDKTFNADFKLEADKSLPKIEVVPQDIGRVLLNLVNNAFYACAERSRSVVSEQQKNLSGLDTAEPYKPTVTVSTKNLGDRIKISVKDNGNGIPESIKDKIFQPFFTTKPTGQGTGLGLSLAYDMVKAHGGELSVMTSSVKLNTKMGEGTVFTITLPLSQ